MINKSAMCGWLLLMLALMLLVLPMQWVIAAMLAAVFHELCHYGAVRLCGGTVNRIRIGIHGTYMEVEGLTSIQELLCALAGPFGSFLLLFLARWLPRTAICAGFQGIYNLLPVYPLDGGRVISCAVTLLAPVPLGEKICKCIELVCLFVLIGLGLYGTLFRGLGILPLALAVLVALRARQAKIPCKPEGISVQ